MAQEGSPVGHERRFVWEDGASAVVAAVGLVLCLRGKANSVPCAFIPFALPALLFGTSPAYRRRVVEAGREAWNDLEGYAAGGKTPWRGLLAFVVVPVFLVYLSNDHFDLVPDSCPVVPTAASLWTEGNTDLDEFYRGVRWWRKTDTAPGGLPYFLQRHRGRLYSAYPAGMVSLAMPVVGLARVAGADLLNADVLTRLEKMSAAAVAAAAVGVFFLIALHLARPGEALAVSALLAFASGMATTVAQNLWQHDGVVLGSLVLLLIEFRRPGWRGTAAQGFVCGCLSACRMTSAAFLVPFGVWVLVRAPRRAALLAVAAAVSAAPWVAYYEAVYGGPVGPSSWQIHGAHWSKDVAWPLLGVLFCPGRGLLVYQPWVILAPLAFVPRVRGRASADVPAGWEWVCAAAAAILIGVVAAWSEWWGGYCWGSRLVVEAVPLCAVLCVKPVAVLLGSRAGRAVVLALAVAGVSVHAPSLYLGAYRWNQVYDRSQAEAVWSWSRAPFLAPWNLPPRSR